MPMRRVAAPTAPLTTMPMIRTDSTSPSTPKATRNGTNAVVFASVFCLTVR